MELHIWLNEIYKFCSRPVFTTLMETEWALKNKQEIIDTTQIHFCSTVWLGQGYKIFVHMLDGQKIELKIGQNECTDRYIHYGHNLAKLLLANEFGYATID